jgi:branched-chain amino acid transport system permease protein
MLSGTDEKVKIDYRKEVAVLRTARHWLAFLAVLIVLLVLPLVLRSTSNLSWLTFTNITFITIIAVLGLNIITGMAGQVSMGHAAFVMVGAYTSAVLIKALHWPFWGAFPVAALITAVVGMIVGAPSLRLKGFYLAVATLAFFLVAQFIVALVPVTGGALGILGLPAPAIGGLKFSNDVNWFYLILAFLLVFVFFSVNLTRSRLGRAFVAIRDNEAAAASMGIHSYATKLRAFFIGSFFAGIGGALLAGYMTSIRPDQYSMWDSIWYLGMIVIGGAGTTAGAIVGVVFLRLISQIRHLVGSAHLIPAVSGTTWVFITTGIYGLIILLFVYFQPYGFVALWQKFRTKYKWWPAGH